MKTIPVNLDDGALHVPEEFVTAICDEYDEHGGLTVSKAAVLIDKWKKVRGLN